MGEFLMSFQQLIDHPDEILYFNYMIEDVISNLQSKKKKKKKKKDSDPHHPIRSNWRTSIPGENKLVLVTMKITFLFRLREIINVLLI